MTKLVNISIIIQEFGLVAPAVEAKPRLAGSLVLRSCTARQVTMFYYTYVLKSKNDSRLYIGSTGDLRKRIQMHNSGQVTATRNRRPLVIVYYEACQSKKKAEDRERYFKTGFGRGFLKTRL